MANLYSQYTSGTQFTAGAIAGSSMGTSGANPLVDRVNKAFPDDYEYVWFDNAPSFNGNTYVSPDINLNQNLSGCRIKGSYFASGAGSMTWDVYKVSGAGATVNESLNGSFATHANPGPIAFDNVNMNMVTSDYTDDYIFIHDGITGGYTGSFAEQNLIGDLAVDDNGNLLEYSLVAGSYILFKHSGLSSTMLGSLFQKETNGQSRAVAFNYDTKETYLSDQWGWIYRHSGLNGTALGSFQEISLSGGDGFHTLSYDYNNSNLIASRQNAAGWPGMYVYSGISSTILGSWTLPTNTADGWGATYAGAGSVEVSLTNDFIYQYDLGMQSESLAGSLTYNTAKSFTPNIDQATYPKIRLKVNRSISQNKLHKVQFDYL